MENPMTDLRERLDDLLSDLNHRAEEIRENFMSFRETFGKEFRLQTEHLHEYRERLEAKGREYFRPGELAEGVRDEVDHAVKDLHAGVDRFFDSLKERIHKAR